MNILILHNFYQHHGGEDAVVAAEAELLRTGRHRVHVETVSNVAIKSLGDKFIAFLRTPHDSSRKQWMHTLIERYEPEIVHIHNFFPLLTPAIHEAASEAGVAVVQTLHNYRLICANGMLMRYGVVCEKCLRINPICGVAHRCYRSSLTGSIAVVQMQRRAARNKTWKRHVHRFIALTEFARGKFIEGGLAIERVVVKPNFVSVLEGETADVRRGALFVGRLSVEKGAHTMLEAWKRLHGIPLRIAGDGPESDRLVAMAPPGVIFLGRLPRQAVQSEMLKARVLIMPSQWYEGFPMTIAEAYAAGLPVIASRLGAMAELVVDGESGFLFTPGDPEALAAAVRHAFSDSARLALMGEKALAISKLRYTAERNLHLLQGIYHEAIAEARSSKRQTI